MKVKEAIAVLTNMNLEDEVFLSFNNKRRVVDNHDPDGGSDHPCGGKYETQAERFGY